MKARTIKSLANGTYFTKTQIENPKESQVWIRGDYDRSQKRYECVNFADMCKFCYLPGDKFVFTDFTF